MGRRRIARRYSMSLGTDMLYVALPFDGPGGRGIVRVARPLSEVEATIARRPFHRLAGLPGLGLDLAIADAILRQSCARLSIQEIGEGMRLVVALPPAARPLGDAA